MSGLSTSASSRMELLADMPLVGREGEALRLHEAILNRESLLICGPAGTGKTALILKVLSELPLAMARCCFYLSGVEGVQPLLRWLIQRLYESDDATLRRQLHGGGIRPNTFRSRVKRQSTSRLKGAVYRFMEKGDYWLLLDHLPPLTHAGPKIVRELVWMRKTPVFLLAKGSTERDVGHVGDVYWGSRQQLSLGPLSPQAGRELLEWCIQKLGLEKLDLKGFREEVLRLSGLVPGTIVRMCRLAQKPKYQFSSRLKTKLIHIGSLMSGARF